jgi:hypothetical protein
MLRFGNPDCSVSLILTAVRGTADTRWGTSSLAKQHLTEELAGTMTKPRGCDGGYKILLQEKWKVKKVGQKLGFM